MRADFNRDDTPPSPGPKWWVERIRPDQEGLFTVFSRSIYGVWTHWGLYGSQPCFSDPKQCHGCKQNQPKRWKGYLHAYDHHHKRQCFLEVTPGMAEEILKQVGQDQPIRGYRLKTKRGKGAKARVRVEVLAPLAVGPDLVDEKYPEDTLRKLWNIAAFEESQGGEAE